MAVLSVSARMRFPSACFKSSACFFDCSAFFKTAERTCSAHCVSGTFGISAATCSRSAVPSVRFLSQMAAFPFAFSRARPFLVFRLFHDSQTDFRSHRRGMRMMHAAANGARLSFLHAFCQNTGDVVVVLSAQLRRFFQRAFRIHAALSKNLLRRSVILARRQQAVKQFPLFFQRFSLRPRFIHQILFLCHSQFHIAQRFQFFSERIQFLSCGLFAAFCLLSRVSGPFQRRIRFALLQPRARSSMPSRFPSSCKF